MAPNKRAKLLQETNKAKYTTNCNTTTANGLSLKLLVDHKTNHVIFAEAGKDVIDFLFNLLQMPLGSIIHLLTTTNTNMVGSIANIHSSVRNLDDDYMQSDHNKDVLLKPCIISENSGLLITQGEINPPEPKIDKFYKCSSDLAEEYCCTYTDSKGTLCSECGDVMNTELNYVDPNVGGSQKVGVKKVEGDGGGPGGYVKGVVTYMVMDDLTVAPLSTISGLTLLNKFSIKDTGLLEERRVSMGMEQGLALLKASFESETVLTDVFLGQKK